MGKKQSRKPCKKKGSKPRPKDANEEDPRGSRFQSGRTGLKNEGNTCYFNSMMQSIVNCGCFVKPLMEAQLIRGQPVTNAFKQLLRQIHRNNRHPLSTQKLRNSLAKNTGDQMFVDGSQHDSWLALNLLITAIAKEWQNSNRNRHPCPIGLQFKRPLDVPDSVSDREFAQFNLDLLSERGLIAEPTACFWGVLMDEIICHGCKKSTKTFSVMRASEIDWKRTGVNVRLSIADEFGCLNHALFTIEDGLNENCSLWNLESKLGYQGLDAGKVLFFGVNPCSQSACIRFGYLSDKQQRLKHLQSLRVRNLFALVHRNQGIHKEIHRLRMIFSVTFDCQGRLVELPGLKQFDLIDDSVLYLTHQIPLFETCLRIMSEGHSTFEHYCWMVIHRRSVMVYPRFQSDDRCYPIILVGIHHGFYSAIMASNDPSFVNRFPIWVETQLSEFKLGLTATPSIQTQSYFSDENTTLDDCLRVSEFPQECCFDDSRCENPECDRKCLTFTRIRKTVLPPRVVLCHLHRDIQATRQKDNRPVECPHSWMFKDEHYRMVGATQHSAFSRSIEYGHYTAVARSMRDGVFFAANDSSVRTIDQSGNHHSEYQANLIVYEREPDRDEQTRNDIEHCTSNADFNIDDESKQSSENKIELLVDPPPDYESAIANNEVELVAECQSPPLSAKEHSDGDSHVIAFVHQRSLQKEFISLPPKKRRKICPFGWSKFPCLLCAMHLHDTCERKRRFKKWLKSTDTPI